MDLEDTTLLCMIFCRRRMTFGARKSKMSNVHILLMSPEERGRGTTCHMF
jgi:hypothetical protein